MPHSAGHIYSSTDANGKKIGVNTDDISATISVSSHDIGYLCSNRHGKTCKWAHDKPVIVNQPAAITDAQRKAVNHGLVVTNALQSDGYTYNLAEWTYNAPSPYIYNSNMEIIGGRGEFGRETDWDGYVHTSKPPIYIMSDEPDESGCTVVTWDEGTTKIDDFKILAGFLCGSHISGPPAQIGISMDELNFGASTNISKCTFGLLYTVKSNQTKVYLGATKQFDYGTGELPCVDFSTKIPNTNVYNNLTTLLRNSAIGSYIEVLPVIDTMDFSASRIVVPNSGLTGFPLGKKLRIYHKKSDAWYLASLPSSISVSYVTDKSTGAAEYCGAFYLGSLTSVSDNIKRKTPSDPDNQYYELACTFYIYNNRSTALTLAASTFYFVKGGLVAAGTEIVSASSAGTHSSSITIAAKTSIRVLMRFRVTVANFNKYISPIPNLSSQPVQYSVIRLASINPNNLITAKNSSGVEITQNWTYSYKVTS